MKKIVTITLLLAAVLLFGEEDLLFFCGGRLFGASRQSQLLTTAGCKVKLINSRNLAGFGGNIRKYEDTEPEKKDGITPEFTRLNNYKAVMFTTLSRKDMEQILTPERIEKLRQYVKEGGILLLDAYTPPTLGDLLPVTYKSNVRNPMIPKNRGTVFAERPDFPEVKELPARWEKMTLYRIAFPKPGSVVHSSLYDASGNKISACVVSMKYGKGKVIFYNARWTYSTSTNPVNFTAWGYSAYCIRGLLSFALGKPLRNKLKKVPEYKTLPPLNTVDYTFTELKNELRSVGNVQVSGRTAIFSNGLKISISENGSAEVWYPDMKKLIRLNAPILKTSGNPQSLNGDNNEAIVDKFDLQDYPVQWNKISCSAKDNLFSVLYVSDNVRMRWEFKPVEISIDGRKYIGYGDRIVMETLPIFLESVVFDSVLPNGKIRRNTCYTKPRGYLETVLTTEAGGIATSKTWQFFCSGQPFTYVYYPDEGIFAEMVDYPIPCYVSFTAQSKDLLNHSIRLLAGRRKTPAELPFVWHIFSAGKENGNNDYIALYQFVRQYLRKVCGIKTFPQVTQASFYLHGRKKPDLERSAKVAADLNFKSVWLSYCPLQMVSIPGKMLADAMQIVKKYGLEPMPWTAGGYNHKDSNPVFKKHPDWFIRNKDGSIHRYFKILPVGDFNNPEFRNWFLELILKAKENGLERVYHDMGGEISNQVNYYPPTQPATANLDGLILLLQEYSKQNIPCSVEGMNPLTKDQALFNVDKSYPLAGKEFAYVGGTPLASVDNGQANALFFDYFRLLMFNATINIDVDGYRNNFERIPGELEAMKKISEYNKIFNVAHTFVPDAFVRESPFGTAWIGSKTGALFFEREVKHLKLKLPSGWKVMDNKKLDSIPAHSVIYLQKK